MPGWGDSAGSAAAIVGAPLAILGGFALLAPALGRRLRPESGEASGGLLERLAVSSALGFGAVTSLFALLAAAGFLRPWPVAITLLLAAGAGFGRMRGVLTDIRALFRALGARGAAVAAIAFVPLTFLALYPPVAFDATLYHLPFARGFLRAGGLVPLPDLRFPVFPQLAESLFAGLMLLGGDGAAQAAHVLATAITAALAAAWGGALAGRAGSALAAGIWLGSPLVVWLAPSGYVEPSLALYATAAFVLGERWRRDGATRDLLLAGVCAGWAASVKYLGLVVVAVLALQVLAARRPRLRSAAVAALVAAVIAAPWYARIARETGNPFYPYFGTVFGTEGPTLRDRGDGGTFGRKATRLAWDAVRWPWDAAFARKRTAHDPPPPLSPVYALALPVAAVFAVRRREILRPLGVAAAGWLILFPFVRDARLLAFTLPLASVAAAGGIAAFLDRLGSAKPASERLLFAAALLAFLPCPLYAGIRLVRYGPLPASAPARDAFLGRWHRGYQALAQLNRIAGGSYGVYAYHAEELAYFADGRFVGDWFGPAGYLAAEKRMTDAASLHAWLSGFDLDHLFVRGAAPPAEVDPAFPRFFRPVFADGEARVYALRPPETR